MSKINVEHIKVLDIGLMKNTEVTVSGDSMILTPLPSDESDYERGMRESMQKIAKSCGRVFSVDIGYEQLPDLVDSLVNPQVKPKRTRTEYERVIGSIFDLRDEFERGELYQEMNDETYEKITGESKLGELFGYGLIYRRIEKEIDWRDEVHAWQRTQKGIVKPALNFVASEFIESNPDKFLELCRVALRANGEIE